MREQDGRHCDRCGVLLTRKNNKCGFELCDNCNNALNLIGSEKQKVLQKVRVRNERFL